MHTQIRPYIAMWATAKSVLNAYFSFAVIAQNINVTPFYKS